MNKGISRGENAKRNIVISLLCQVGTIICGLITPRYMLSAFGSEANGAITSITTFLGYIMLLEGGIGGVARAALYKPLAENDEYKVSAIMMEIKTFFRHVGFVFIAYVLIIAVSFKSISHTDVLDWTTSFFLVLIISGSTFVQYFIGISNSVLIIASQRQYINILINMAGTVLNAVLIVILTTAGYSLITVKLMSSVVFALKPLALWIYVRRNYNLVSVKSKGNELKDKWTGLGQHIAYFLHSHTDVVVLTIFGNLKDVSIYGIYYMITNSMQIIVSSFASGMEAVFGDMYAKKEVDKLYQTFSVYDTLISIVSNILFGTTAVLLIPFIQIYTNNITDANYVIPVFGTLLVCASLIYCLRTPYHNMIIAAGHFKQTKMAAYGEAIINIIASVILVINFGLIGVAIGTVLATLFRFVFYAIYLSKNVIMRNIILWIKREIINAVSFVIVFMFGEFLLRFFSLNNFIEWAKAGALVFVTSSVIVLSLNFLFYRNDVNTLRKRALRAV